MPGPTEISPSQLARLIGTPDAPDILDVRIAADIDADPALVPGARLVPFEVAGAVDVAGSRAIVVCHGGRKLSHGVAAQLRLRGVGAEVLEGGMVGWRAAGLPTVGIGAVPGAPGSLWVTRARPKIDRIACPWLVRRFVDARARFLFVPQAEVEGVAARFGAIPFDVPGVRWSHRDAFCTFDVMLEGFGLRGFAPLDHLARIVRAADTDRLGDEPAAAGLLAVSLGLSRMYRDDLAQLEAAMPLYDALFRWCRDATGERHDWSPEGAPA